MATLRFHLPFARRTPPSGDAGTSAPAEYPPSSTGALLISINCPYCAAPSGPFRPSAGLIYGCGVCGGRCVVVDEPGHHLFMPEGFGPRKGFETGKIVEGDGPQESGVTPSPSIDTDQLNKLLIEAAATMREQSDQLAAVHAALNQLEADYILDQLEWEKYGTIAKGVALSAIRQAVGR